MLLMEGWKAELTLVIGYSTIPRWFRPTCPHTVIHPLYLESNTRPRL